MPQNIPKGRRNLPEGIRRFYRVYIDDILIFSRTMDEHIEHVRKVKEALNESEFSINFEKSRFPQNQVKFLGRTIS